MAISKIRPLHGRNGESILRTLYKRLNYGMNPKKTDQGRLISGYQCNPPYAYKEFYAAKQLYENLTGRRQERRKNVIAYLIVQSYKVGEITPENANRLAYETALEFTKGDHAFLVCTHVDKKNIHTHVYFNSTTLDATWKFQNPYNSYEVLRSINDRLCQEHGYFVIEHPRKRARATKNGLPIKRAPVGSPNCAKPLTPCCRPPRILTIFLTGCVRPGMRSSAASISHSALRGRNGSRGQKRSARITPRKQYYHA